MSYLAIAQNNDVPTSTWVPIKYSNLNNQVEQETCGSDSLRADLENSYLTMRVEKVRIYKERRIRDFFRSNRRAFATGEVSIQLVNQEHKLSKVSGTVKISKDVENIDISTGWSLFNRMPWILESGDIKVKVGYTSNSIVNDILTQFSESTSEAGISLNSAFTSGVNIISFLDKIANGDDSINLFSYSNGIPLTVNDLCTGRYVIFASDDATNYSNYLINSNELKTINGLLTYNGEEVDDISYVIVSINVESFKYDPIRQSLNADTLWARKFKEAISSFTNFTAGIALDKSLSKQIKLAIFREIATDKNLESINADFNNLFNVANSLLLEDASVLNSEKQLIELYVKSRYNDTRATLLNAIQELEDSLSTNEGIVAAASISENLKSMDLVSIEQANEIIERNRTGKLSSSSLDIVSNNLSTFKSLNSPTNLLNIIRSDRRSELDNAILKNWRQSGLLNMQQQEIETIRESILENRDLNNINIEDVNSFDQSGQFDLQQSDIQNLQNIIKESQKLNDNNLSSYDFKKIKKQDIQNLREKNFEAQNIDDGGNQ